MKKVLYDTNVILDVLLAREPHREASEKALDAVGVGSVAGYVSAHAVTTLFYLLRREVGSGTAKQTLGDLLSRMTVAPVTDATIRTALLSPCSDFEDAVTHAAAREAGVSIIVSRNVSDFPSDSLSIVRPDLFLAG